MSSNPMACLSSMPWHVKEGIVKKTHGLTRLSLRNYSKEFRTFIDKTPITFSKISFSIFKNQITLSFTDSSNHITSQEHKKVTAAVSNFTRIFFDPNVQIRIGELEFTSDKKHRENNVTPEYQRLRRVFFAVLGQKLTDLELIEKLHVKVFKINLPVSLRDIPLVLEHLKPVVLEKIHIFLMNDFYGEFIGTVNLKQFQEAKEFRIGRFDRGTLYHLQHFQSSRIHNFRMDFFIMDLCIKRFFMMGDFFHNMHLSNVHRDLDYFRRRLIEDLNPRIEGNVMMIDAPIHMPNRGTLCFDFFRDGVHIYNYKYKERYENMEETPEEKKLMEEADEFRDEYEREWYNDGVSSFEKFSKSSGTSA